MKSYKEIRRKYGKKHFQKSCTANRNVETPNTELPAGPGEEMTSALSSLLSSSIISAVSYHASTCNVLLGSCL